MIERDGRLPAAGDELWTLVEGFVEGAATVEERERLESRLRAEEPARLFYVAYLDLHASLQWRMRGESSQAADMRPPLRARGRKYSEARSGFARRLFGSLARPAVAASLVLAAGLLVAMVVQRHGSDEGEAPDLPSPAAGSVAVLIDNSNPVWEEDMALPTETGAGLPPGRLKLKAGVVEIAFHGGGEVLLEGPADFDVKAPDQAFLHRGKLTARVPEGGSALQVSMPGVVVTDLVGECGLLRDESGRTEVHVFAGQIGADPTDGHGEPFPGTRLAENAGARVDASRQTLMPVPLNERAFARLRPEIRVTDAAVRGGQFAGRNFGTASQLMVKNSIPDYSWEAYLSFDLSGITGRVCDARVRLVPVRVGQPFENAVAVAADNLWGETTITWDKKPLSGPAFAEWTVQQGEPVEFDVTRLVHEALAGDKRLALRIFAPNYKRGKNYVQYGSRKGEAETRPQLLITTAP